MCSAEGGAGNTSPPTDVSYTLLCARLDGAPSCAASAPDECNVTCAQLVARCGTACGSQLDALSFCANAAPVRCVGTVLNPFSGCDAQFGAAIACASCQPRGTGP